MSSALSPSFRLWCQQSEATKNVWLICITTILVQYYKVSGLPLDRFKEISRHRHIHSPPATPPGFYDLGDFHPRPSQFETQL